MKTKTSENLLSLPFSKLLTALMRSNLFLGLLLIPILSFSQKKTLNGYLGIEGGELFSYKIEFTDSANQVSGIATTWMVEGKEVCAKIVGTIDKQNKELSFRETEIISNKGFASKKTICLITALLKYRKEEHNNMVLSGSITSNDVTHVTCAQGAITFTNEAETKPIFEEEKPKEIVAVPKPEAKKFPAKPMRVVYEEPAPAYPLPSKSIATGPDKITEGKEKDFEWKSDTVVVEIWDNSRVDGDVVAISFNGKTVLSNYSLVKDKKTLKLLLEKDMNELTIFALNEGSEQPNTADILLYDGSTIHPVIAYNSIGKQSTIRLKRLPR